MHHIKQVLSEYFHYNKSDAIDAIFGNRVLVNGGVVNCPTNQIKSGEKIKLYFHRHEPEVQNTTTYNMNNIGYLQVYDVFMYSYILHSQVI